MLSLISSRFEVLKSDSATALSRGLPGRGMDCATPCDSRRRWKALDVHRGPWPSWNARERSFGGSPLPTAWSSPARRRPASRRFGPTLTARWPCDAGRPWPPRGRAVPHRSGRRRRRRPMACCGNRRQRPCLSGWREGRLSRPPWPRDGLPWLPRPGAPVFPSRSEPASR